MWTDVYLRFANKAAWDAMDLAEDDLLVVDVVGFAMDEQGEAKSDFLVNLRVGNGKELPAPLTPFVIARPEFPQCVFAGSV